VISGRTFTLVRNASVAAPPLSATDLPRNGVAADPGTSNAIPTDAPPSTSSISRSGLVVFGMSRPPPRAFSPYSRRMKGTHNPISPGAVASQKCVLMTR
jgi:hypothetical protein